MAAQSVTLAWNANTETNLAGYRLSYGFGTRSYQANVAVLAPLTTATVTNLEAGRSYYFAVSAYTQDGLESDYSDEVSYTVPSPAFERPPEVTESLVVTADVQMEFLPFPGDTEELVLFGDQEEVAVEPTVVIDTSSQSGPVLKIIPVGQPPVAYSIRFEAPANRECELQVCDDLSIWRPLVPFKTGAASRQFEFNDLRVSDARRYYRLKIQ